MTINLEHIKPGMMLQVRYGSLQKTNIHMGVDDEMLNMVGKIFEVKSVNNHSAELIVDLWTNKTYTEYWSFHVDDIMIPEVKEIIKKIKSKKFDPINLDV